MLTKDEFSKTQLRAVARDAIAKISKEDKYERSKCITKQVIDSGIIIKGSKVLLYMPLPSEVDTKSLLDYCLNNDCKVLLPRIDGSEMVIVEYGLGLKSGVFGILEPVGEIYIGDIDIAILPLLGADKSGNRLGKGKGYYDKFLSTRDCIRIGLAFKEQVFESVPTMSHDQPMDKLYFS